MLDTVFDPIVGVLNSSLNLRLLNQNVISANIANADTPGFKAKTLEFESALRDALEVSDSLKPIAVDPEHRARSITDPIFPSIVEESNGIASLDGNTVDRGSEMVKLAQNQLLFDASTEMLKKKLAMLKYVVSEGGGR